MEDNEQQPPKNLRERWIDALRSGKYRQGRFTMRRTSMMVDPTQDSFCCLGVLCDVADPTEWNERKLPVGAGSEIISFNGPDAGHPAGRRWRASQPPDDIMTEARLSDDDVDFLMSMNDIDGKNFLQIADWLEKGEPKPKRF